MFSIYRSISSSYTERERISTINVRNSYLFEVLNQGFFLIVFNRGGKKKPKETKTKLELASLGLHGDTVLTACVREALQI